MPAGTTVWRLLIRLDAPLLAGVLAGWLRTRNSTPTPNIGAGRYRRVIAVDGKTLRGARRGDGRQVHLLSALDTATGNRSRLPAVLEDMLNQNVLPVG